MRIVHLTSTFPRQRGGPGGSFLEGLAEAQAAAGHEVSVVAPHDAGLPLSDEWGSIQIRRFRYAPDRWETLAYRGGLVGTARGLRGLVLVPVFIWAMFNEALAAGRQGKLDALHAHWWLPGGVAGVFAARRLGVPLIVTCHGSDVALAARSFLARRACRWVLRRATAVGTVSEALKAQVRRVTGVDATVLRMPAELPSGPPGEAAFNPSRADLVTPGDSFSSDRRMNVVAAGRLSPEKGFDVLLEALALAPDVTLELIGDGPVAENLRNCGKRLDLNSRLRFSGALPPAEYLARLAQADAVVVPSRTEGLGLVAVEALASGRPVIASDVGGLPEVLAAAAAEGAARLVPPEDPEALASALRELPLLAPSETATSAMVDRHRPEAVAHAHAAAYAAARTRAAEQPVRKRRRPLRWIGAAAGIFLLLAVVGAVTEDLSDLRKAIDAPHLGWLAAAVGLAVATELAFALASATVGRSLVRPAPPRARTAATYLVAQQAKHIPGGIWPAVARAGLSRRLHPGLGPRLAFFWVLGESLASVAAGLISGGAVLLAADQAGLRPRLWAALALAAGLGSLIAFAIARQTLLGRILDTAGKVTGQPTPGLTGLAAAHLPAWAASGATTAALAAAIVRPEGGLADYRLLAAAAILASVAGFLALPVPAGIGVREAVFVALAASVLTGSHAVVLALAARLLSLAAQVVLAGVALPLIREKIPRSGNDLRIADVDQIPADESG